MGKILFWVVVIFGGLLAARLLAHHNAKDRAESDRARPAKRRVKEPKPVESMVRCEHCGIHLPRSEAVMSEGHIWCSQDHAKLGVCQ
ncbi:MAG: PP0621 family protein [Burkholderiaceae bacterium]